MSEPAKLPPAEVGTLGLIRGEEVVFHSPGLEFGHELQTFVPFVHGLREAGCRVTPVSQFPPIYFRTGAAADAGTQDDERAARHYQLDLSNPDGRFAADAAAEKKMPPWRIWCPSDVDAVMAGTLEFWRPPPYRTWFANQRFRFAKPTLVVQNKYATEPWKHFADSGERIERPYNFIPIDALDRLLAALKTRYQVIYNRFTATVDKSVVQDPGDFDLIETRHPEVLTVQRLARDHGLSHDETQLEVYANTSRFVGVQGGGALLLHYFGGKAIVMHRLPPGAYERILSGSINFSGQMELQAGCNFYRTLFPRLSGQVIEPCYDVASFECHVLATFA